MGIPFISWDRAGTLLRCRSIIAASSLVLSVLSFVGCAHVPYGSLPPPTEEVVVSTLYRPMGSGELPSTTFEVYLQNTTTNAVSFESVALDGLALPEVTSPEWAKLKEPVKMEGAGMLSPALASIAWWQFYPLPDVAPGETAVFQIQFAKGPEKEQKLVITDSVGKSISVTIPKFQYVQNPKTLRAITYTKDYRRMFVQYQSGRPNPVKVWVNNREVAKFSVLKPKEGDGANMLAFDAPLKIATGKSLHVKIAFKDNESCETLVRALSGIMLDAYGADDPSERKRLGLDEAPAVRLVRSGDVACADTRTRQIGSCIPAVIGERSANVQASAFSNTLTAVQYCVTTSPQLRATYGPAVDAALASPYSLSLWSDVSRLVEREELELGLAAESVAPRPWLWIPDVFKRKARFLEPAELDAMAWTALIQGCKGVRYYQAFDTNGCGFTSCPLLDSEIVKLNGVIREREDVLSPLLPVNEETLGNRSKGVRMYTSWVGDRGQLILLRNLDYRTDDQGDDNGKDPRFKVTPKQDLKVTFRLPDWLGYRDVRDFETGKRIKASCDKYRRVHLTVENLDSCAMLWVENKPKRSWLFGWLRG